MGPIVAIVLAAVSATGTTQSLPGLVAPGPNACLPGTGSRSWCGDGGPATSAKLAGPRDVAVAADGTLLIADTDNNVIRRVSPDGVIGTLAGDGSVPLRWPRAVEPAAHPRFDGPSGVAVAPDGSVLVADTGNHAIRRITADGRVRILVGGPRRVRARLNQPSDVVALPNGDVLVADAGGRRVLRLTAAGAVSTVAGAGELGRPLQLAPLPDGGLLVADGGTDQVYRVDPDGTISLAASSARGSLTGVASAPDGAILTALSQYSAIMRFGSTVGLIAGIGRDGFSGDGLATRTRLGRPRQLAIAPDGSLLIAEEGNDRIRRLTADGLLVTVAGSDRPRPAVATVPEEEDDGGGGGGSPSPAPPPMGGGGDNGGGGGGGRDCYDPHPQFRTFNFAPALDGTLKVRGAKVDVQTSVTAKVVVRLERSGRMLASRSKRARNDRESTAVKLKAKLARGVRYVVEMQGHALNDSRIRRCDRRYLRLR